MGYSFYQLHKAYEFMSSFLDYMFKRRIFTVDPDYFPLARMREIVDYLHSHNQRFGTLVVPCRLSAYTHINRSIDDRSCCRLSAWRRLRNL